MSNIYITSNITLKKQHISSFLKSLNKELEIKTFNIGDDYVPNQLINSGDTFLKNKLNNIELEDCMYILCVYNLLEVKDCVMKDYFIVIFKDIENGKTYEVKGSELEIDYCILDKYPKFINIIDDMFNNFKKANKKYIYDGCDVKLSSLIHSYYPNIPENNWSKTIFNKDITTRVNKLLNKISKNIII